MTIKTDADRQVRLIAFRQTISRWDVKFSPYLYISPFFILFAITGLFPLLYTAFVSVHDWSIIGGQGDFVGAENYEFVIGRTDFWVALRNTFSIFVLSSIPQVILALIIAAVLDTNIRAKTFWRMGVLLPYVVTPVAIALIFSTMFADQTGIVNRFLTSIGIDAVPWHAQPLPAHFVISTMVNFRWTGYNALIFLAAMQAIPRDYYEAAMIDGAGRLRRFFSITIPQLRPTIIFVVVTSTIGGLQIFDEPRLYDVYGRGGADQQWLTLTMYIYELGWTQQNFGRAAAVAWLLFLVIVIFGAINLILTQAIASGDGTKRKRTRNSKVKVAK
jgi:cellobiose transport system permease protein